LFIPRFLATATPWFFCSIKKIRESSLFSFSRISTFFYVLFIVINRNDNGHFRHDFLLIYGCAAYFLAKSNM